MELLRCWIIAKTKFEEKRLKTEEIKTDEVS